MKIEILITASKYTYKVRKISLLYLCVYVVVTFFTWFYLLFTLEWYYPLFHVHICLYYKSLSHYSLDIKAIINEVAARQLSHCEQRLYKALEFLINMRIPSEEQPSDRSVWDLKSSDLIAQMHIFA